MKRFLSILAAIAICLTASAQGRSISLAKKITEPYKTESGITLKVGTVLQVGTPTDGRFYAFIQLLNGFNEPIQPAKSSAFGKKQPIKFFKEQDGVMYAFTEYFCIIIEPALETREIKIVQ